MIALARRSVGMDVEQPDLLPQGGGRVARFPPPRQPGTEAVGRRMPIALVDSNSKLATGPGVPRLDKDARGPGPGQADLPDDVKSVLEDEDVRRGMLLVLDEGEPAAVVAQIHHRQLMDRNFSQAQVMVSERMGAGPHLGELGVDVAVQFLAGGDQVAGLAWIGQASADPGKPHFVDAMGTLVADLRREEGLGTALGQTHAHGQEHAGLPVPIPQLGKTNFELVSASFHGRPSRLV